MASTLAELYSFESQLETGFHALLSGTTGNIHYRRDPAVKATPFIDVLVTVGAAVDPSQLRDGGVSPGADDVAYEGTLMVRVATNRMTAGQDASHHALLAGVRVALMPTSGDYNATNFPDLAVLDISPEDSDYSVDDERNIDITELEFSFIFGIRDTAWP